MSNNGKIQDRIAEVARILVSRGVATEDSVRGCSVTEIDEVEGDVRLRLPLAYREFLAKMGRNAGNFYVGTDIFYPNLLGNTKAAHELVAEDKATIILPKDSIAFAMHQGYQFTFFQTDEGDDPPVYYYMEQSGGFVKKADQFTQFLADVAHDSW
jgi:hypothetical protein